MMHENFISKNEQKNLIQWAYKEECRLRINYNGPHRYFNKLTKLTDNNVVFDIKDRIIKTFNIHTFKLEPGLEDWLGMIKNGGYVHLHNDPQSLGEHHRFNVIVQLPKEGGMNIYNGEELVVKERMLLRYRADLHVHGTTKVIGDRHRINLSFGFLNM